MQARWHGRVVAESDETLEVGGYRYFPPDSVRKELLTLSPKTARDLECPHGVQFYDVADGGGPVATRKNLSAVIRRSERAFTLEPGGSLELTHVELTPGGRAAGLLALEGEEKHQSREQCRD